MKTTQPRAIRLSINKEVGRALSIAKRRYPTLSDAEILKLGLSKIVTEDEESDELKEIRLMTAQAFGYDYLADSSEDIYKLGKGKKVNFK